MALTSTTTRRSPARTSQVTQHYNISRMTLWRWQQCPDFPRPLKRGRVVLYDISAIERWLQGGAA